MEMKTEFKEIEKLQVKISELRFEYWKDHVLFSYQWWLLVISTIVALFLWWKFVDRSMLRRVLLYGFFSFSIVIFLDSLGTEIILWDYPQMVLPWGSRIIYINIIITVIFMFLYQRFILWKPYLLASVAIAALFSFLLEPLSILLSIYKPYQWESYYSFLIYILLLVFIKWLVDRIHRVEASK